MTRNILVILLWAVLAVSVASADTIIPGGYVSGTWTAAGSPYNVQGNITIHADSILNIEPGVTVEFQSWCYLLVNGSLEANGTEGDSILFTGTTWAGIDFEDAPDSSHLTYCIVQNVVDYVSPLYGGITCMNCNPVLSHCRISNNQGLTELWGAGGIMLYSSNAEISWCNISGNSVGLTLGGTGGGVKINNSHPTITWCNISGNNGDSRGGGIDMLGSSSLIISNCTLTENRLSLEPSGMGMGGGIASQGSDLTVIDCTISHNIGGMYGGGGIWISGGDAVVISCTIDSNTTIMLVPYFGPGGGIYADCDTLLVDHCTFIDNRDSDPTGAIGSAIHTEGNTSIILTNSIVKGTGWPYWLIGLYGTSDSISYSDFYLCRGPFIGNILPGLGELTTTNANGDSCDQYYNIFEEDPLFVDYPNADYHLQEDSPCIDAGDPASQYDPDATITDMGRYFFDQRTPDIELSATQLDFGAVTIGTSEELPLVIYNVGDADLILSDLSCGLTLFSTNWDPLDSLILPGDSLQITVTFAPEDTLNYTDTLCIENNCESCGVELLGHGEVLGISDPIIRIPEDFALRGPYPNPFNPMTTFRIELPVANWMTLETYDISGKSLGFIVDGWRSAGYHEVAFDGSGLASGVYLYWLEAGDFRASGKMVLIK